MYSYHHKFHAGNFADVHKHIILISLIEYLKKKPKPFCVLDAFAGEGVYRLTTKAAQLNAEHNEGIQALLQASGLSQTITHYLNTIKSFNEENVNKLKFYPGSPLIIHRHLRADDRVIAVENHPTSSKILKENLGHLSQMGIHQRDAFEAISGLVPFAEKRGLIFIDPSYEVKSDYNTVAETVDLAYRKMPNATIAIWYPILQEDYARTLLRTIEKGPYTNLYFCEWRPFSDKTQGLLGSGLIIINKGWQLENEFSNAFRELNQKIFKTGAWRSKVVRQV